MVIIIDVSGFDAFWEFVGTSFPSEGGNGLIEAIGFQG
jgi:hypothetical protein